MRKMKSIPVIMLIALMIFFTGCDEKIYYWETDYSYEQIVSIKNVYISPDGFADSDYKAYFVLEELSLDIAEDFINDVKKIEMKKALGSPMSLMYEGFLVEFEDGNKVLITQIGIREGTSEGDSRVTFLLRSEQQFDAFYSKYASAVPQKIPRED